MSGLLPAARPTHPVPPPAISLGRGLLAFPDAARAWVRDHPHDRRTAAIRRRISSQPTALWLTGDDSFGNLRSATSMARAQDRTAQLVLWNIPQRYDGLTSPTSLGLRAYETWVAKVASGIARTRAIVVLEPDALWFYDRLPSAADRRVRMAALRYAVRTLHAKAPNTRVYLDAGTSSGSVTPARMATLLRQAGLAQAAGYAVNTSSYSPARDIAAYAGAIRAALQRSGVTDPRFVVDTGRNGNTTWDDNWCNPPAQRLGTTPRLVRSRAGLDLDLWIKAPGTSDGDCGPPGGGAGSYGGEFLPSVAYRMISG